MDDAGITPRLQPWPLFELLTSFKVSHRARIYLTLRQRIICEKDAPIKHASLQEEILLEMLQKNYLYSFITIC